jgi:hypothetical protein
MFREISIQGTSFYVQYSYKVILISVESVTHSFSLHRCTIGNFGMPPKLFLKDSSSINAVA